MQCLPLRGQPADCGALRPFCPRIEMLPPPQLLLLFYCSSARVSLIAFVPIHLTRAAQKPDYPR
jgi:hypothetical protein